MILASFSSTAVKCLGATAGTTNDQLTVLGVNNLNIINIFLIIIVLNIIKIRTII